MDQYGLVEMCFPAIPRIEAGLNLLPPTLYLLADTVVLTFGPFQGHLTDRQLRRFIIRARGHTKRCLLFLLELNRVFGMAFSKILVPQSHISDRIRDLSYELCRVAFMFRCPPFQRRKLGGPCRQRCAIVEVSLLRPLRAVPSLFTTLATQESM